MISAETLTQGGVVAVIGICTVFAVLAILWGVLEMMRLVFTPKKKKAVAPAPVTAPVATPSAPAEDEGELIAVLTAAVACCLGKPASSLNIRSYKRIDSGTPIWNKSARRDNLV